LPANFYAAKASVMVNKVWNRGLRCAAGHAGRRQSGSASGRRGFDSDAGRLSLMRGRPSLFHCPGGIMEFVPGHRSGPGWAPARDLPEFPGRSQSAVPARIRSIGAIRSRANGRRGRLGPPPWKPV